MKIQENRPLNFDRVKDYLTSRENVRGISTPDFTINEKEIALAIDSFNNERPNIYAIFIKKPTDILWTLKYIGQRESAGIKQRLREHFIKCNSQTGSQLERVNEALSNGYEIGIKLISILPDDKGKEHYRLLYESMLIHEFSNELEWNIQK